MTTPDLISKAYAPMAKKEEDGGLIYEILEKWAGLPNRQTTASHNQVELSLNELLFEYEGPQNKTIEVSKFRELHAKDRLNYNKKMKDDGFLYLIVTMRNRHYIQRRSTEGKINLVKDYPGLNSLINEWNKQQSNPYMPDRVLRMLFANKETRRPDYIAAARIELVRRIRRGLGIGTNNLDVAEHLLKLTKKEFEEGREKIEPDYWAYTCPNSLLGAAIELQNSLNLARKGGYEDTKKSVNKVREMIKTHPEYKFGDLYLWWTYHIELRVLRSQCLGQRELERKSQQLKDIEELFNGDGRKYVKELQPKKVELRPKKVTNFTVYESLQEYHNGLVRYGEWKRKSGEGGKWKPDIEDWSKELMYAIIGSSKRIKMNEITIEKMDVVLGARDEAEILRKVDKAILNGHLLVGAVIRRNSHLTTIKLLLIVVDLFARMRYALGEKKMAEYRNTCKFPTLIESGKEEFIDLKEWNSKSTKELREVEKKMAKEVQLFSPEIKHKFTEEIRVDLLELLYKIKLHIKTNDDNDVDCENEEVIPIDFIKDCIESLSDYNFENMVTVGGSNEEESIFHRTSLGELGHLCGSFIGLANIDLFPSEGIETKGTQIILNGYQRKNENGISNNPFLKSKSNRGMIITSDLDGEFSPYIGPAGESRAVEASDE